MKGNPDVISGLQQAITIEATLALQYFVDSRDVKRLGLHLGDGLATLHDQCQEHVACLVGRLLFLEGAPKLDPKPAATHDKIGDILAEAKTAEEAAVAQFAVLCKQCYEGDDMSNFHFYQHLAKWHREGDEKFKGHLAWLQKELYQFTKLGESEYIAVNAVKN
jgi:bacterioferritin (cytochrome b1)